MDGRTDEVEYGLEKNRLRVVRRWQLDNLVGRLLTYIDATYTDPAQRRAHKDIVKQSVYNWFVDVGNMGFGDSRLEAIVTNAIDDQQVIDSEKSKVKHGTNKR